MYTPVNTGAYIAAYSGAISGMAGGWLTDSVQADYDAVTQIAGSFAQAFDLSWNSAKPLNVLEESTIKTVSASMFLGRPTPSIQSNPVFDTVNNWNIQANACVALVRQSDTFFSNQGINVSLINPYLAQANWWIDSVLGNDNNPGTLALPLKTTTEFCNRICPGGAKATLIVTIICTLIGIGPYQDFALNLDCAPTTGSLTLGVQIIGTKTSSAPIVLSSVTNAVPSTNTRQVISTLSGSFTDLLRITVTSGPHAGAISFSTGLNGSPQSTFASLFMDGNDGHLVTIAPGNTVIVDTLQTIIKQFQVTTYNQAYFVVADCIIKNGIYGFQSIQFGQQNVQVYGCESSTANAQAFLGPITFFATRFFEPFFSGGNIKQWGCIYQNGFCIVQNAFLDTRDCCTFDNFSLIINQDGQWNVGTSGVEFVRGNGTSAAVQMGVESTAQLTSYCWGGSTNYGIGFEVFSGAGIVSVLAAYFAIPATINMKLSGSPLTYAGFVGADKQRAGCYISLFNDTTATINVT